MAKEFKLQDPGEGVHEAEILEVLVGEGDEVGEGDALFSVETDKAAIEIPASFSGTIETVNIDAGDTAEVGDVLLTYSENGAGERAQEQQAKKERQAQEKKKEQKQAKTQEKKKENESQPDARREKSTKERPVPASPATRRLARELDVDLHAVESSGPEGRVTSEDVKRAAEGEPRDQEAADQKKKATQGERDQSAGKAAAALPDFSRWGDIERIELRGVRRATAKRMAMAWSQIPHVTHRDTVDITELEKFRRKHKAAVAEQGGALSLTVLVLKAAVAALRAFPRFNASLDTDSEEIILKHYYHIGVAVDSDRGLLVPVLRDVERKTIFELARELKTLAQRTRKGELEQGEMQGGSFTITNPGPLGGDAFTPIINYPQVAILGLGQASLKPTVQGDLDEYEIIPRLHLPLMLAFDHRVNDGAEAARFVSYLVELLGDPDAFVLGI